MRKTAMVGVLCVALACFVLVISPEPAETQQSPDRKPNIVWVMTDDQDFRSWRRMPNVRELAKGGTYFPRTFATTSQCCPSRTTLLTGQYAHNHGVKEQTAAMGGGYEKVKELGIENNALPTWLAQEGYQTAYGGKYLNQYYETDSVPPGWKQWWAYTKGMGHPDKYWVNENGSQTIIERSGLAETDYLAMKGEVFVRDASKIDSPFFLALSPFTPHKPYFHAKRHANRFNDIKAPKYPNFNEEDVSDKPYWVQTRPSLDETRVQQMDEFYRDRMRGLLGVDEMVGRVVKALKESGEWENTIIVYTSDNGYLMGEHRIEGKSVPYEGSIRVPFIVAGPGIPQGVTKNQMIANIDWAPTIADWTGATPAIEQDGRSIVPLLSGNATEWRKQLLIEAWGPFKYTAIRTAYDKIYAEHREYGESEYYDLREDFHQLESKHQEMPAELQDGLRQDLRSLEACSGAGCAQAEGTVDTVAPDTTIGSGPSDTINTASASFDFSSNKAEVSFQCSLDDAPFVPCTSPKEYTNLADGSHTFRTRAVDAVGNVDPTPASHSWRVDTQAPDTAVSSGPTGTVKSTSASLGFSSSESDSTFECSLDGSAFASCTSPKSYSGLKTGSHIFKARAIDAVGNVDATPANRSWKIDTIKPTVSGMSPRHKSIIRDTTPTIKSVVKDNMTNLKKANINLYVNGKLIPSTKYSYSAATDKLTYNSPKLPKGKKTVKIVATDAAGNMGMKSWYFTIKE